MDDFERSIATKLRAAVPEPPHTINPAAIVDRPPRSRMPLLAPVAAAVVVVIVAVIIAVTRTSSRHHGNPASPASPYGRSWTLVAIRGGVAPGGVVAPVGFRFARDGAVSASDCNSGQMRPSGQEWTFTRQFVNGLTGPCGPELTVAQTRFVYGRLLTRTVEWRITGTTLTITHRGVGSIVLSAWKTYSDNGDPALAFQYPPRWHMTKYTGMPATVFDPILYLSEQQVGGTCSHPDRQRTTNCFNGDWPVADDGVVIRWGYSTIRGGGLASHPGTRTTRLGGHRAKIFITPGEVDAVITVGPTQNGYFTMQATFGTHASAADRAAIEPMLQTVRIRQS